MNRTSCKPSELPKRAHIRDLIVLNTICADHKSKRSVLWRPSVVATPTKTGRIFILTVRRLQTVERHLPQPRQADTRLLTDLR